MTYSGTHRYLRTNENGQVAVMKTFGRKKNKKKCGSSKSKWLFCLKHFFLLDLISVHWIRRSSERVVIVGNSFHPEAFKYHHPHRRHMAGTITRHCSGDVPFIWKFECRKKWQCIAHHPKWDPEKDPDSLELRHEVHRSTRACPGGAMFTWLCLQRWENRVWMNLSSIQFSIKLLPKSWSKKTNDVGVGKAQGHVLYNGWWNLPRNY